MIITAGSVFPGIQDLMHKFDELTGQERAERIEDIKKHLSDLMIVLRQATLWLSDDKI